MLTCSSKQGELGVTSLAIAKGPTAIRPSTCCHTSPQTGLFCGTMADPTGLLPSTGCKLFWSHIVRDNCLSQLGAACWRMQTIVGSPHHLPHHTTHMPDHSKQKCPSFASVSQRGTDLWCKTVPVAGHLYAFSMTCAIPEGVDNTSADDLLMQMAGPRAG